MVDTVAGLEIRGDINISNVEKTNQRTVEQFEEDLRDAISKFGFLTWTQFTPYFNDGDPCVFNVYEVYAAKELDYTVDEYGVYWTEHNWPEEDDRVFGTYGFKALIDEIPAPKYYRDDWREWQREKLEERFSKEELETPFFSWMDAGAYDDVCFRLFGDHAEVVVVPEGVFVSEREHE